MYLNIDGEPCANVRGWLELCGEVLCNPAEWKAGALYAFADYALAMMFPWESAQ